MYIYKMHIRNYKSFLDSGDINVDKNLFALIGQNNTGKSAVLDAIQCVFPSSKKTVSATDFHKGTTDEIQIDIWFDGVTNDYIEEMIFKDKILKQKQKVEGLKKQLEEKQSKTIEAKLEKENENINKIREQCLEESRQKYKIDDDKMHVRLVAKHIKSITQKFYIDDETEIKEADLKIILPQIKLIPAIRDPKNESTAGANSYLKELIQMLDDEMQTDIVIEGSSISYNQLNKVIGKEAKNRCQSLGDSITMFYNEAIGNNDYKVIIDSDVNISKGTTYNTKVLDMTTGIESDILNCGTGYQSMIILSILESYVKISSRKFKYILLIEEPEVYLHPSLQRKMIDTLITISQSNQVLFTSHSPITVSKLEKKQVNLVKKTLGDAKIEEIIPKIVIDELGIKADDIIFNKGIIFVEGKDDKAIFDFLLNKIEDGLSSKINVLDAGNCDNLKFYANAEMLINNEFNIPTLIVRDCDTKEQEKRRTSFIEEILKCRNKIDEHVKEKIAKSVRITEYYSIEGYFIDKNLLNNLVSTKETQLSNAVKCYECQYNYYSNEVYNNRKNEKVLSSWYQPKYFLEKFLDKYKSSQKEALENHDLMYKEQWRKFKKCTQCCESKLDDFFEVREAINRLSKTFKEQKNDLMLEIIKTKSLDELKRTKLLSLINLLEVFNDELN